MQDTAADGTTTGYDVVVDAQTGEVLHRQNTVFNAADDPTWLVFPQFPDYTSLNEYPWNYPSADVRDLWCWTKYPSCKYEIAESPSLGPNVASKVEWDRDAQTGLVTFQTTGNNADDIERWIATGAGSEPRVYGVGHHAVSPTRDYDYPWTNIWFENKCNPANLAVNGNDIEAAIANLFAMHNVMHDYSYHLGFDERHWNAQQFNYGMGTLDHDATLGNAAGRGDQRRLPDLRGPRQREHERRHRRGPRPQTNMFLWQPLAGSFYAPCVDGDYDMTVIGHEYGHAIENRMIAKGVGARQGFQAGAMGEAFGDFDAVEYLNEANDVARYGEKSPFVEGPYVTGNPIKGIRNYDMSWAMGGDFPQPGKDPYVNPLNFSDIGYDTPGPEVHSDGEPWIAVQFDIRDLFLDRYPSQNAKVNLECLRGERPAEACPGNRRWIQDYYDAMVLMPRAPTMLDARNAMIAADTARFGGANVDLLWLAFAERGFGQAAATPPGGNDTDPIPDFSSPVHQNATLVFTAVAKDGSALPVNANIYVGDYEARATPIADTNPATAGPNLDNIVPIVPSMAYVHGNDKDRYRAYNFVANAPGYGHVRFKVEALKPGETRNIVIRFPTNYASRFQGAVASGDGVFHNLLIDDTESTDWDVFGRPAPGSQVVVKLGQGVPVTFQQVNVSALITGFVTRPGDPGTPPQAAENRFTALRAFDLYSCTAGEDDANPTCDGSNDAGWKRILRSAGRRVPGRQPAPDRAGHDHPDLERAEDDGDARPPRREVEPVHGAAVLPGRPGQRPAEQLRLRHRDPGRPARARERGARGGVAGVVVQPRRRRRRRRPALSAGEGPALPAPPSQRRRCSVSASKRSSLPCGTTSARSSPISTRRSTGRSASTGVSRTARWTSCSSPRYSTTSTRAWNETARRTRRSADATCSGRKPAITPSPPRPTIGAGTRFIAGEPMKPATKTLAGSV